MQTDAEGSLPTFFFRGEDAYMCYAAEDGVTCEDVGTNWAQWAMGFIGQTPLLLFPFLADMAPAQFDQVLRSIDSPDSLGTAEILGETAYCLAIRFGAPLEVCYTTAGVPVRISAGEGPGSLALEAVGYQWGVPAEVFELPADPIPHSAPFPGPPVGPFGPFGPQTPPPGRPGGPRPPPGR
jgi:hypothetical protein